MTNPWKRLKTLWKLSGIEDTDVPKRVSVSNVRSINNLWMKNHLATIVDMDAEKRLEKDFPATE